MDDGAGSAGSRWARWPLFAAAGACISAGIGLFASTSTTGREVSAAFLLALGGMLLGAGLALYILKDR
jgi:ABC-type xylose transport system permease subunit